MKCLIVEDDQDLSLLWQEELDELGIDTTVAHSRSAAMDRLLIGGYDAVIIDLNLPDGHGVEVAEMADFRIPGCPVVIVTGSGEFADGQIFNLCRNVAAVFRKTINMDDMYAFVQHLSRKRGGIHAAVKG
jgi:DNA-binding response OmpR family regulator